MVLNNKYSKSIVLSNVRYYANFVNSNSDINNYSYKFDSFYEMEWINVVKLCLMSHNICNLSVSISYKNSSMTNYVVIPIHQWWYMISYYTQSDYGKFVNKLKYYNDIFYRGSNIITIRDVNIDRALNIIHLNILFRVFIFLVMFDIFSKENNKYLYGNIIYNREFLKEVLRYFSNRKKSIDLYINFTIVG